MKGEVIGSIPINGSKSEAIWSLIGIRERVGKREFAE